jgi:H+/Cl- antiporter ClcA
LTIGSGGSGGREGPTGQISAGFASLLARELDLSPADARIAVVTGIGSGIGAIFGAPLGGAVLAAEILYRDDFDAAALLPSFVASTIGYVIFGAVVGYTPLFGFAESYHFTDPLVLIWFAVIGLLGGLIGLLYARGFYGISAIFTRMQAPRWVKPTVGGVMVGFMALAIPEVLGTGYGWIQQGLGPQLLSLPLWIVLILPFARIVATGLSIGSGGSGGIFGPGMVIGAFIGASVWRLFEPHFSTLGPSPAPYVIVGMMCCFGGISRAPLALMLMVAEMTDTISLLAPAMIAVGLAWFIVKRTDDTIYRSQLKTRADSPAERLLTGMPVLRAVPVQQAMAPPRLVLTSRTSSSAARQKMDQADVVAAPVVDDQGRYEGSISRADLAEIGQAADRRIEDMLDSGAPTVAEAANLDTALDTLIIAPQHWVPVLDDQRHVTGTVATSDIVRGYRLGLLASLQRFNTTGDAGYTELIDICDGSALVGETLARCHLPASIVITTIQRERDILIPNGSTVLEPRDQLTVIGQQTDIATIRGLASPTTPEAGTTTLNVPLRVEGAQLDQTSP